MNGREGVKGVLNDGEDNMMDIVMMDTAGEMLDVFQQNIDKFQFNQKIRAKCIY